MLSRRSGLLIVSLVFTLALAPELLFAWWAGMGVDLVLNEAENQAYNASC